MSKHTPTPWFAQEIHFTEENWKAIRDAKVMACVTNGYDIIAVTWDTEDDDNPEQKDKFNAAHIVKCVNMHDELIEALERLLSAYGFARPSNVQGDDPDFLEDQIVDLLAKAKGEP